MDLIPGITQTGQALSAERIRMDVIAQNIANAYTTSTEEGGAYKRKMVTFESFIDPTRLDGNRMLAQGVRVSGVTEDEAPGRRVHIPGHPHADAEGMVEFPNVEMSREMVDLISASRAYEANLQVVKTARQMAQHTMRMGR